jgi:hypothetical protein
MSCLNLAGASLLGADELGAGLYGGRPVTDVLVFIEDQPVWTRPMVLNRTLLNHKIQFEFKIISSSC